MFSTLLSIQFMPANRHFLKNAFALILIIVLIFCHNVMTRSSNDIVTEFVNPNSKDMPFEKMVTLFSPFIEFF